MTKSFIEMNHTKEKKSEVEVIVSFLTDGTVIPRSIRYFSFNEATYKCENIREIKYIMKDGKSLIYRVYTDDGSPFKLICRDKIWNFD